MKKSQNRIIIIFLLVLLIQMIGVTNSKYATSFFEEGKASIAEPVVELESFENVERVVNKLDFPIEYTFKLKNYKENKINEVDFLYNIEVIFSNNNFPIKYKIIDISNGEIIENSQTLFKLSKCIREEKIYKLIIEWDDKKIELSKDFDVKIKINLKQYKIGEI